MINSIGRVGSKKKINALRGALGMGSNRFGCTVFDNIQRFDVSDMRSIESYFDFYNRSARPEMEMVRHFIERSIKNYPVKEVDELISRFRSRDDVHFKSASFELFLHEALRKQGFKLLPHPDLPNGRSYKPDFLVEDMDGSRFYLEAVLATERNELDRGGEARKAAVWDILSKKPHKNFQIEIFDEGYPATPPSSKKLKRDIHKWLDTLDPDDLHQNINESGWAPLQWSHDGWNLKIHAIPLAPESRGKSTNLIIIYGMGGGMVDAWSPIRDAVRFKGNKYGDLDLPLIVAVNLDRFHLKEIDEMQALFGQEKVVFNRGCAPELKREPNGAWFGKHGARVSAAWIFNDLKASSLAVIKNTIYFNPWAVSPAPDSLKCFPFAFLENGKMQWNEGLSFREIFDLNKQWPENM